MLVAKGLAILAVVTLHVLALFPESNFTDSQTNLGILIVNQALRFSVPLFLALSGYGLAKKYQASTFTVFSFLTKRVVKLLPAYFVWSALLLGTFYVTKTLEQLGPLSWKTVVLGYTDYHLYFVPVIFQFYLLFIVLRKIKNKKALLFLTAAAGITQVTWLFWLEQLFKKDPNLYAGFLYDQYQYRLLINWAFYFILGFFLAQMPQVLQKIKKSRLLQLLLVCICAFGLFASVSQTQEMIAHSGNIVFATGFTRVPVMLYASSCILLLLAFFEKNKKIPLLQTPLEYIGIYSYGIYLSHTLFLRVVALFL